MYNVSTITPLSSRQKHLDLSENCLERGGNSTNHKGVLAQYLNTNIPSGRILLCHACNNGKCSNPKHLYWGTDIENVADSINIGTHSSVWERMVKKYGPEKARQMNVRPKEILSKAGKIGGSKPKTEEHRKKISEGKRKYHALVAERQTHDT